MARKPWPMRWIALAIILFIVPYSYLLLRYRKPTSFEPYEDARERKHIAEAGYTRISLSASRLIEPAGRAFKLDGLGVASVPGGLPPDLAAGLIDPPLLPVDFGIVGAAPVADATHDYTIRFDCVLPRRAEVLAVGAVHLYRKNHDLNIVIGFAPLADGLVQRMPEDRLAITLPISMLEPGSYRVVLVGSHFSKTWPLQVH